MKIYKLLYITLLLIFIGCTREKTPYGIELDLQEIGELKEVAVINKDGLKISLLAGDGKLYKGYNEISIRVQDAQTNEDLSINQLRFLPIMEMNGKHSCPHSETLTKKDQLYSGYSVFTMPTNTDGHWVAHISFQYNGSTYEASQEIHIYEQPNKNRNITSFTGNDGNQYIIALIEPQVPQIAENQLVVGIYKYTGTNASPYTYSMVENHTLLLDPRMPEPSMGNHSSPNNKDLKPRSDGLYEGVVNYTMSGEWTLNLILKNSRNEVIKGTSVSTKHTPGVWGEKSELHLDIEF